MKSTRSYPVTLVLVLLFGFLGAHRFYAGRRATAILQAATLGGFAAWWVVDIFIVSAGRLLDADRLPIRW
jgi:TM2 domain-containing membrane protein YozV